MKIKRKDEKGYAEYYYHFNSYPIYQDKACTTTISYIIMVD